jgi:MoxR-like ATPase
MAIEGQTTYSDRMGMIEYYTRLSDLRDAARAEVSKVVVGNDDAVDLMLVAAICHGHVLVEGPPGSAKTLIANAMARVLGVNFKRVQFTPDTSAGEIVGKTVFKLGVPEFQPGVLFTNVLLADEINRTPPKTQAALLEAMQERLVTHDGKRYPLPDPFLVIGTQNPFEQEGVFPLAESQLDRFLFKVLVDYCDEQYEVEMLGLPHAGVKPDLLGDVTPLLGPVGLDRARQEIDAVEVPEAIARYIVKLVRRTRELPGVQLGASSRSAIHLLSASKANARLAGRSVCTSEDVQTMAHHVLRHRLIVDGMTPDDVVSEALVEIPAPPVAVWDE